MKVAALVGPTAAGKTAVATELCVRWGGEIVGVDASQVYRGLDIGTGKATPEALRGVRHHLIDVVAPDAPFDAGRYVTLADAALVDIQGRGRRPLLCERESE
jgi:tRNA dimethylallyltransferase